MTSFFWRTCLQADKEGERSALREKLVRAFAVFKCLQLKYAKALYFGAAHPEHLQTYIRVVYTTTLHQNVNFMTTETLYTAKSNFGTG